MTLLGTTLILLVLGQGIKIHGIELETNLRPIGGLSHFHDHSYFETVRQAGGGLRLRNAYGRSWSQNRGPLVLGRNGRRSGRNRTPESVNTTNPQDKRDSMTPGSNGAASNDGGLIKWENVTDRFAWRRKKRQTVECCKKIILSSSGPAGERQWDRLGLYYSTGQILHGRMVYQHENWTQSIFYIYGEYDGWLLGPTPDVNFGGIKNSHDGMCVHTSDVMDSKGWGYYGGPKDTKDPEEAYPYWKHDDGTLAIRCVPNTVHIDSRKVPDETRGPMLRKLYRRSGRLIREKCGPPPVRGKLNMDAWIVTARCGGDCHKTDITLSLGNGEADILIVAAQSELDLTKYCFRCHSFWSGRLLSGKESSWSTIVPGLSFRMYVIIVGYADYVSLNVKIDSSNLVDASSHKLK